MKKDQDTPKTAKETDFNRNERCQYPRVNPSPEPLSRPIPRQSRGVLTPFVLCTPSGTEPTSCPAPLTRLRIIERDPDILKYFAVKVLIYPGVVRFFKFTVLQTPLPSLFPNLRKGKFSGHPYRHRPHPGRMYRHLPE